MVQTLTLKNVVKSFGKARAVNDVSFTLNGGETIALVGHNGAGKTTLMKLMLGLLQPNAGSIDLMGENPSAGAFSRRDKLGYLPENVAFNIALTGQETLAFYARLKRQPVSDVARLLALVGLTDAAHKRVGAYSKGMRQRLGLAQALLGAPKILLLDEPTTGLDPALRQTFYNIIHELRENGATVLLSSHALTELEEQADRVIIMNRGIKVADGSIDELRQVASLPVRLRLRLIDAAQGIQLPAPVNALNWRRTGSEWVEADLAAHEKLPLLKTVLNQVGQISDLDIIPPTLDDLYAHFLHNQEVAA